MSSSEIAFREAVETGAVSLVTSLTGDSSDVLLQLNALDLLEQVRPSWTGALAASSFLSLVTGSSEYLLAPPLLTS